MPAPLYQDISGDALKVYEELFKTEETYMEGLRILIEKFQKPLEESQSNILPREVFHLLFASLPEIYNLNQILFSTIETEGVGKAFLKVGPFLKVYSVYAKTCDKGREAIAQQAVSSPAFAEWKAKQEKFLPFPFIYMEGYLITPIQRIPRYMLLIRELLKKLPEDHGDRDDLVKAGKLLADITSHVNESVANAEKQLALVHIQNALTHLPMPIVAPGRDLLLKDPVIRVRDERCKARYLFLFNDCLLCARPSLTNKYAAHPLQFNEGTTFIYRDEIVTRERLVQPLESTGKWYELQNPGLFWFEIRNVSAHETIILGVDTEEMRQNWVKKIQDVQEDQKDSKAKAYDRRSYVAENGQMQLSTGRSTSSLDELSEYDSLKKKATVTIRQDEGFATRYEIKIQIGDSSNDTCIKRYSEILDFYTNYRHHLFLQNKEWQPFPGKKLTERFQPWVLEQRRAKFELMFEDLISSDQNLAWPEVREFLVLSPR